MHLDGPRARRHRLRLHGEQGPLLWCAHGLGTDQQAWSAVIERLGDRYRILCHDWPGVGPLLPEDFDLQRYQSLSAYADDLLALMDEVDAGPCRYVGHSVSGLIGALAAVEAPALFERLLLFNASPRYLDDEGYRGGFDAAALAGLYAAMRDNYEAWIAGFAPLAMGPADSAVVEDFARGFRAMRPDITLTIARSIFESDLRAILPALRVPTVLLHARDDIAVPAEVARYLQARIAGAELVWMDAQGHLPHMSAPDEVARLIGIWA